MIDQTFFKNEGPFSAAKLKEIAGGDLRIDNPDRLFKDVAPLNDSFGDAVSCYNNKKYLEALKLTKAGLCIIHEDDVGQAPAELPLLISKAPYRAYAKIATLFYPEQQLKAQISPLAAIAPTATLCENCQIEPFAVIGEHVEIGANTYIGSHTTIADHVKIGRNCYIGANTTISHSLIGNHVNIKPGARIGQKGFGFDMDAQGHLSVPQLGRTIVEDYVEIGSNTTIDRGSSGDTIIGKGSRVDNLVQLGHNVCLGQGCVIVAQVGISGSTKLGKYVIAAGQAGFAGHLTIGDNARIAGQSGILRDVPPGQALMGTPAINVRDFFKQAAILAKMTKGKG